MPEWFAVRKKPVEVEAREVTERETIETREGTLVAEPGDLVIRGVEDEVYPIDGAVFEQTYEVVD